MLKRGSHTPWGPAQEVTAVAEGIERVDTASHGGYKLSPARLAEMSQGLRSIGEDSDYHGPGGWFEEDCEWAAVAIAFPQYFPLEALAVANQIMVRVYGWRVVTT